MKFFTKSRPSWGILLLGPWLIATGLLQLVPRLSFSGSGEVLAGLAIVSGLVPSLRPRRRAGDAAPP